MAGEEGEKSALDDVSAGAKKAYEATKKKLQVVKEALVSQGAPDLLPECEWLIVTPNSDKEYIVPKDENGDGKIEKGETVTLSKKEYLIYLYRYQMKVLQMKKSRKEREKSKYDMQIAIIDKYVEKREKEYGQEVGNFIDGEKDYEYYRDQYNAGFGKEFYAGDVKEQWLKRKMAESAKKMGKVGDKDRYIYSCSFEDIDNPKAGKQHFDDIRTLRVKYDKKVDTLEDEIEDFQSQIEASKSFVERISKMKK